MIIYVSRDWLTRGIEAVEAELFQHGIARTVHVVPGLHTRDGRDYFFKSRGDYAETDEAARKQALRKAKIRLKNLRAEIERVEAVVSRIKG